MIHCQECLEAFDAAFSREHPPGRRRGGPSPPRLLRALPGRPGAVRARPPARRGLPDQPLPAACASASAPRAGARPAERRVVNDLPCAMGPARKTRTRRTFPLQVTGSGRGERQPAAAVALARRQARAPAGQGPRQAPQGEHRVALRCRARRMAAAARCPPPRSRPPRTPREDRIRSLKPGGSDGPPPRPLRVHRDGRGVPAFGGRRGQDFGAALRPPPPRPAGSGAGRLFPPRPSGRRPGRDGFRGR